MRCARREAGPPEPAAAPRGRARNPLSHPTLQTGLTGGHGAAPAVSRRAASPWRRPALLPVLAALLGALGLFAAAPAAAQTPIWSATLTVDEGSGFLGCSTAASADNCSVALSEDEFEYNGVTYRVWGVFYFPTSMSAKIDITPTPRSNLAGMVLHLGATRLPVVSFGIEESYTWNGVNLQWTDNQQVAVSLVDPTVEPPPDSLTLSASDTAPREGGGPVTVTATVGRIYSNEVQLNVLLRGTATWGEGNWPGARPHVQLPPGTARGDGSRALAAGADYWTPAPDGVERGFWFGGGSSGSSGSIQAGALLKIPRGQRSASFTVAVLDDAHEDSGETIGIEVQAYENIPYTATFTGDGHDFCVQGQTCTTPASWMKHLTGASGALTLTIQNHEGAEAEAARPAARERGGGVPPGHDGAPAAGSGEEERGPLPASDGEDDAPGEHGGGVPPDHGGASATVPGVPGTAAHPGRERADQENRRAHPPVIGRRARAIGSPYCFVPGAAELGALGESAHLAYRLDSARDFDLCLWAPDPNWRDAPAYASCRGAGGALPEYASLVRGAGREEISVERAPGLMACVVPAEAAAGGGAWRLRIAPDNPDNTGTEDTE